METPPPYIPPQKKSKTGLIIGLVVGGILLCCVLPIGLVAGGGYFMFKKASGMIECSVSMTTLRDALIDYSKDHGGKLPKADKWQDDVRSYYAKKMASKGSEAGPFTLIPAAGNWDCKADSGPTGIAFNEKLSGKKLSDIEDKSSTILLFQVPQATTPNLHMPYAPQEMDKSPKMFNEHIGWIEQPVEGAGYNRGRNGKRSTMDIKTGKTSGD